MARSTLTAQTAMVSTANAPIWTAVDSVSGNQFSNPDGRRFIQIINTGASGAVTACVLANSSYAGVIFPTQTGVAPSSVSGILMGPFALQAFNQTDGTGDGNVYINYSGSAYRTIISLIVVPITAS